MSLDLPEFGFHIGFISLSSLDRELIERGKNWNQFHLSIGLEMSFETHMKVLSDGLFNSVPESNLFDKRKTESIIGKGEGNSTAADLIRGM